MIYDPRGGSCPEPLASLWGSDFLNLFIKNHVNDKKGHNSTPWWVTEVIRPFFWSANHGASFERHFIKITKITKMSKIVKITKNQILMISKMIKSHIGVMLGSCWGHVGVMLGSFWCHFGVILVSFFESCLQSFLVSFGSHLGVIKSQTGWTFWAWSSIWWPGHALAELWLQPVHDHHDLYAHKMGGCLASGSSSGESGGDFFERPYWNLISNASIELCRLNHNLLKFNIQRWTIASWNLIYV